MSFAWTLCRLWLFPIALALTAAPGLFGADSDGVTLKVTVDELMSEFRTNEIAAERKYKSVMILLTGKIDRIVKNGGGSGYFIVLRSVTCHFKGFKKTELEKLKQGEEITILGRCKGKEGELIEVRSCEIIRLPALTTPASAPTPTP